MRRITQLSEPSVPWIAARWITLLITVGLIVSFWVAPDASLSVLWYILIPVLPASFLVNVELWRNICPLATLNTLTSGRAGSRKLTADAVRTAGILGIALLVVMVPARRFLFNVDASILGMTVVGVCVLALLGGVFFDMKAGFCNSLCPVLPVERLYGQRPLLTVSNARCIPCTSCSKRCLDLQPSRSAAGLAEAKGDRFWGATVYGAFALAFPGFVFAYYSLSDTTWADAGSVYGVTALWSAASWVVLTAVFVIGRASKSTALLVCTALAVGLYYWYAPPGIATEFGLPSSFVWAVRVLALGLVIGWLGAALKPPARKLAPPGGAEAPRASELAT